LISRLFSGYSFVRLPAAVPTVTPVGFFAGLWVRRPCAFFCARPLAPSGGLQFHLHGRLFASIFRFVHLSSIGHASSSALFRELARPAHDIFSFFSPAPRFFRGARLPSVFFVRERSLDLSISSLEPSII
jgi:hypothetical protein